MHRPNTDRVTGKKDTVHRTVRALVAAAIVAGIGFSSGTTAWASFFSFLSLHDESLSSTAALSFVVDETSQTIPLLKAVRNVDPTVPRGGGTISVVDSVSLSAGESPFKNVAQEQLQPASPDQISWYLVQDGDTLSQVADLFDVSVNTIVWANELDSSVDIHPGETLLILPISGVQHTVEKGDTVKSLAEDYGGDSEEIIAYNGLAEDGALTMGIVVTIPGGQVEEEEYVEPAASRGGTVVSSGPSVAGYFIHPLPGAVRTQGVHGYNGVDYGAGVGTPIRAAAAGSVVLSRAGGWNGGYGNYVVIDHSNGTQTLYAHLSKNAVWQGQKVVAGQVIGYVGNTGRSTGPHLHFEVRGAANPF